MSGTQREAVDVGFDFDLMPEFVQMEIAAAAFNAMQDFMQRPDADAILEATRERLIREGSTLLNPRPPKQK